MKIVEFSTKLTLNRQGSDFTASGNAGIRTFPFSLREAIN